MDYGTTTRQSTEASGTSDIGVAPAAPAAGSHRQRRVLGRNAPGWWPLIAVLMVQALLSLRLVGADTAFEDEADVPVGRASGVGALAAWCAGAAVRGVFLRGAGDLPAGRRAGRQPRRAAAARMLSLVVHARGDRVVVGRPLAGCSGGGPRSSPPRFSRSSGRRCIWARSPPMTRCRCSWSRWRPGAWCGPGKRQDATGWMVAAAVALALANAAAYSSAAVRPGRGPARAAHRLPEAGRQDRRAGGSRSS